MPWYPHIYDNIAFVLSFSSSGVTLFLLEGTNLSYKHYLTPVEENDDTNAVLSYMCGYQGTQYLSLGIVKIARAWSVLTRLCAFNDG